MVRKRDFIIFLALVMFLLVAIGATVWPTAISPNLPSPSTDVINFDTTTATYTAEVASVPDTKTERIAALRKKISERGEVISAPTPTDTDSPELVVTTPPDSANTKKSAGIELCASYRKVTLPVSSGPILYAERAGSRVFYTNETVFGVAGASSEATSTVAETIVLTLPLQAVPLQFTTCIPSDIVAVTPAGTPIHNADYAKYSSIGEATMIGYTIDGFKLYGTTSNLATDACGGALIDGTYRYYLSDERAGVLGCFAGIPIAL